MTQKKTKRKKNDAYYTPLPLAKAIVASVRENLCPVFVEVLEPSAGKGAFVEALMTSFTHSLCISAIDIKLHRTLKQMKVVEPHYLHRNETSFEKFWKSDARYRFHLAIGNPPYKRAASHVQMARQMAPHVAFLLRLSFLGSQERARTIFKHPGLRFIQPVAQRPKFLTKKKSGDNSEYAVFMWSAGYSGRAEVLPHLWVES